MLLIFGFLNEVFGDNSDSNECYDGEDDKFTFSRLNSRDKESLQKILNSYIYDPTALKIPKIYEWGDDRYKITGIGEFCLQYIYQNSYTRINGKALSSIMKNNLEKIIIPNSVTKIQSNAFNIKNAGLSQLDTIVIPNSVRQIGINAFARVPHIEYHGSASGAPWGAEDMN